jgi:hypothetical protein
MRQRYNSAMVVAPCAASLASPLAAPDLHARWLIAGGLLLVGGIFIGVSDWLVRRLR